MKNKKIENIKTALKKIGEQEYRKGAIEAMSVAVNLFNVEHEIREMVFKTMKIKI